MSSGSLGRGRPYDRRGEILTILDSLPSSFEVTRVRMLVREAFNLYEAEKRRGEDRTIVDTRKISSLRGRLRKQVRTNRLQRLASLQTAGVVFRDEYMRLSALSDERAMMINPDAKGKTLARLAFFMTCQAIRKETDIDIEKVFDTNREEERKRGVSEGNSK